MPRTVRTARAPTDLKPNLIRIKKRNDERADRRKGGERVKEFQQLGTSDQVFGRPRTGYVAHTILTDAALMVRATGRVARAELDEMRPILVTRVSTVRILPLDQKSPAPWWYRARQISGAPGRIRTVDTRFRRYDLMLPPTIHQASLNII